jgi:hypothetical protein
VPCYFCTFVDCTSPQFLKIETDSSLIFTIVYEYQTFGATVQQWKREKSRSVISKYSSSFIMLCVVEHQDTTDSTDDVGHHQTKVGIRSGWKLIQEMVQAVNLCSCAQEIHNVVDSMNVRRSIQETPNTEGASNEVTQSKTDAGFMQQSAEMAAYVADSIQNLFHNGTTTNNDDTCITNTNAPMKKNDAERQQRRAPQRHSKRHILIWLSVVLVVVAIIVGVAVAVSVSKSKSLNTNQSRDNSNIGSGASQSSSSNQDIVDACIFLGYHENPGGSGNVPGNEIYFDLCRSSTTSTAYGYGNTIPTSIGLLTQLTSLTVSGGSTFLSVKGTIPSSIGKLVRLRYLDMQGNELTGTIPSSIESLT